MPLQCTSWVSIKALLESGVLLHVMMDGVSSVVSFFDVFGENLCSAFIKLYANSVQLAYFEEVMVQVWK